jgi:hypothetical protein
MRLCAILMRGAVLALVACAALLRPVPLAAQDVRMSIDEARGAAAQALQRGNPELALVLAEGVLLGMPGDVPALLMKSRALRDLGRTREAANLARSAFDTAADDRDRYFAALLMAQARATAGQPGVAQCWLRRAAEIAPEDDLRAVAVRDFRHLRRLTPWRLSLDMSVEPSDNLNGAPKTNKFIFAGLPFVNPSAVPLSGQRASLAADFVYRVPLTETRRLNFGAGLEVQRVRFSKDARAKVPGVDAADFRQEALVLSLGHEARAQSGNWLTAGEVSVMRRWVGGNLLSDSARLDLSYGRSVAPGLVAGLRFGLEDEHRHDAGIRDAQTREMGLSLTRRFGRAALKLDLSMANTESQSRLLARETRRAAVAYGLGKPVNGLMPRLTLAWEATDYDLGPTTFWPVPRTDEQWSVSLDVLLPEFEYYGFAPEIGVSFRDRSSNYTVYETRGTDLRLGLKSVF